MANPPTERGKAQTIQAQVMQVLAQVLGPEQDTMSKAQDMPDTSSIRAMMQDNQAGHRRRSRL
ncbi:MAG TPA: hypothetical protein DIS84_09060 [Corynebacterium stationis]|nr:hypothetical protein [Corynebacterium stationis]